MENSRLTDFDASSAADLTDWRVLLGKLSARFATGDFVTGARLVADITKIAESLNHHPDVDLRYPHLSVTTVSHDVGHLTDRDRELARRISAAAAALGVSALPAQVSSLEIALDVRDADAVRPFWAAVLGLDTDEDGDLFDPAGRAPALWFQQMEEPRTERNRFHLDLTLAHDMATPRIEAALAAGGTLVSDDAAPSFWVLADAEGNEVCVCTWQSREGSGEPSAADEGE